MLCLNLFGLGLCEICAKIIVLQIYSYVFGPCIEPHPAWQAKKFGRKAMESVADELKSSILRTCKLVYREAKNVLYKRTTVLLEQVEVVNRLTTKLRQRWRIARLELALSHNGFMALFQPGEADQIYTWPATALRVLNLDSLTISFAPPSMTTANGYFDKACQRKAVEMILGEAWPLVRGHQVQLTGFIENDQKVEFGATFLKERKRYEMWQSQRVAAGLERGLLYEYDEEFDEEEGGIPLDGSVEGERVLIERKQYSEDGLKCHCSIPCTLQKWIPED